MHKLKRLMFGRLMAEAETDGGGQTAATETTATDTEATTSAETADSKDKNDTAPASTDPKPYLGQTPEKPAEATDAANDDKPGATAPDEKSYLDAVKANKDILGKDTELEFDPALVKSVIPVCQKHGISVDAANEMANAFAKAQLDGAKAALQERCDRFQKMNTEARAKYNDRDFEQINRGIDKFFKPGGAMNFTIRNSELGADPEFLALMHYLGAAEKEDSVEGAADGGGSAGGDGSSFAGISTIWK